MCKRSLSCLTAVLLLITLIAAPSGVMPEAEAAATKISNETTIYNFCINDLGLNTAAACGVLSNLYSESGFDPTAYNSAGYYGLAQWGGGRLTNLKSFCSGKSYSYSSLEGQLQFMKNELNNGYSSAYKALKAVANTAAGAADAAHIWAAQYEVCWSGYYTERENQAKEVFWPAYDIPECSHTWVRQSYQIEHPHYSDEMCSKCGACRTNKEDKQISAYCEKCGIIGDVNGDGYRTLADVSLLFRHICGQQTIKSAYVSRGELNGDSTLNMRDVAKLYELLPLG